MTGFGAATVSEGAVQLDVQIRSVNQRFLDVVWKLPGSYSGFETALQKLVREGVRRGRVEIAVFRKVTSAATPKFQFRNELFAAALTHAREAAAIAGVPEADVLPNVVSTLLERRDILELAVEEVLEQSEQPLLEQGVRQALEEFQRMRALEGQALETELLRLVNSLERLTAEVADFASKEIPEIQRKVQERIAKLLLPAAVDPQRLAQEIAILADRSDITEEITRLGSHLSQLRSVIGAKNVEGVGKKIEFLVQEIGREINTCGSKSQSLAASERVIEMKSELEKIREQVQNVE